MADIRKNKKIKTILSPARVGVPKKNKKISRNSLQSLSCLLRHVRGSDFIAKIESLYSSNSHATTHFPIPKMN